MAMGEERRKWKWKGVEFGVCICGERKRKRKRKRKRRVCQWWKSGSERREERELLIGEMFVSRGFFFLCLCFFNRQVCKL